MISAGVKLAAGAVTATKVLAFAAVGKPVWWGVRRALGDGLHMTDELYEATMADMAALAAAVLAQEPWK